MYFWKYILAKKAGLSQKKCNMALYGLPVLPIAEAFEKTVTGNPISISDALAQDALSLQVAFTPTQDGTPSIDSEATTEPYLSKVIPRGNKEYYSLVGGTVAWNQLVQITDFVSVTYGGITGTNNGNGTYTVNGRARDLFDVYRNYELTANHVYFAMGCPQGGDPYTYRLALASKTDIGSGLIYKSEYGGNETLAIRISNGTEVNNLVFRPQLFDLTLMFANNPAIADYVYTLEQSEAGSGIAWLKSQGFFTEDYYPYNAGELISVNTSGHKIGSTTYPIDPTDLRGLFKLSNGKLYCEGDIYPPSGSVERKYGIVDLGTLTWTYASSFFYASLKGGSRADTSIGIMNSSIYTQGNKSVNKQYAIYGSNLYGGFCRIGIRDDSFVIEGVADATAFKNSLSGTYLVYPLETPTTETATPYTSPIDVEAGGTEEFVDNRTVPIPVGNETYYASEYEVHGKTGVTVSHGATQDDPNPTEHEVEFTSQGTVYGGTVDIVSGVLSVTWGYIASYNGETLTGRWLSSKDVYAEGTTPSTGAEVAYELATPLTYQLTPQQVQMLLGNNYLMTEDGTITITYMAGR